MKTKPTQHSVKELRGLGINKYVGYSYRNNLLVELRINWLSSDVAPEAVIESLDVESIKCHLICE